MSRHAPVLLDEVLGLLVPGSEGRPSPRLVDCTLGGGGHARALLEALPEAELLGLDRDPEAVARARDVLNPFAGRVDLVVADYRELARVIQKKTGRAPSRGSSPTWASRASSSTTPGAGSRSCATAPSTCGSTRRPESRPRPTSCATSPRRRSRGSSASSATSPTRGASPRPSPAGGGRTHP